MDKIIKTISVFVALFVFAQLVVGSSYADWWERDDVRPTQPSIDRGETPTLPVVQPTEVPAASPTTKPQPSIAVPTATPRVGDPTVAPTSKPNGGGGSSEDDPCAPGKSYTGPYCGWSPRIGGDDSGDPSGSESNSQDVLGYTGPNVLGLSYTAGYEPEVSDIILLTGVLCLLLYLRSKFAVTAGTKMHR